MSALAHPATGAALLALAATLSIIGFMLGRRTRPLMCSCRHGSGMHEDQRDRCHGQTSTGVFPSQCTCRAYDGPTPPRRPHPAAPTSPQEDS